MAGRAQHEPDARSILGRIARSSARGEQMSRELGRALGATGEDSKRLEALVALENARLVSATERASYRRLGWRLMRPLVGLALIAAPLSFFQKAVPPALALVFVFIGAFGLYLLLQAYVTTWARRAERNYQITSEELERAARELDDEGGATS